MAIRTETGGFQGEDNAIPYQIIDKDGNPVDTSDMEFAFAMKLRFDSEPRLEKSEDDGIAHTDDLLGKGTVQLNRADTSALDPDVYEWELRRVDDGSNVVQAYGSHYLRRSILAVDLGT